MWGGRSATEAVVIYTLTIIEKKKSAKRRAELGDVRFSSCKNPSILCSIQTKDSGTRHDIHLMDSV
jgi:hypothetical protein